MAATARLEISRRVASDKPSQRAFLAVSALLFAASAAVTIVWCTTMSAMGGMPMPGGWTMSMAWMRMPGQTWPGAAALFVGMWVVMMVAMMVPSLVPMLLRYRQAVARTGETRLGSLTAIVSAGYFFVWTVFGMAVFPLGAGLAAIEMQQPALARAVPRRRRGRVVSDRASSRPWRVIDPYLDTGVARRFNELFSGLSYFWCKALDTSSRWMNLHRWHGASLLCHVQAARVAWLRQHQFYGGIVNREDLSF